MSPIGGPGPGGIEGSLPQQQNLENNEDIEKKEKDKPIASPLDVGFEKQDTNEEIKEVAEQTVKLDDATLKPAEVVEGGDYKAAEALEAAFVEAVGTVETAPTLETTPAITLEDAEQEGQMTVEKATAESAEKGQDSAEMTQEAAAVREGQTKVIDPSKLDVSRIDSSNVDSSKLDASSPDSAETGDDQPSLDQAQARKTPENSTAAAVESQSVPDLETVDLENAEQEGQVTVEKATAESAEKGQDSAEITQEAAAVREDQTDVIDPSEVDSSNIDPSKLDVSKIDSSNVDSSKLDASSPDSAETGDDQPSLDQAQARKIPENSTEAAVESQSVPDIETVDRDDGEPKMVMVDQDGDDGSPQIDYGGLDTTDDIRQPTSVSDAYAGGGMGDAERGDSVGYQGGEPSDGLEIPGGMDGMLGGMDGMPGGGVEIPEAGPGGGGPGIGSGSELGGVGLPDVGLDQMGEMGDLRSGAGFGAGGDPRTGAGVSENSSPFSVDIKVTPGITPIPFPTGSGEKNTNTDTHESGQKQFNASIRSSDDPGTEKGVASARTIDNKGSEGTQGNSNRVKVVVQSSGKSGTSDSKQKKSTVDDTNPKSYDPEGNAGATPFNTPMPGGSSPINWEIGSESLMQPTGDEENSSPDKPPPITLEELRKSQVDPHIQYGDDHTEGDTVMPNGFLDQDNAPIDPPDMAGGGELGSEDLESTDGLEDIDP